MLVIISKNPSYILDLFDQQFHFQIQQGDANGNGISNAFDINNFGHILLQ